MGEYEDPWDDCDFGIVTERAPLDISIHNVKKGLFSETGIRYRMASQAFESHNTMTPIYIEKTKYSRKGPGAPENDVSVFEKLATSIQTQLILEYNKLISEAKRS